MIRTGSSTRFYVGSWNPETEISPVIEFYSWVLQTSYQHRVFLWLSLGLREACSGRSTDGLQRSEKEEPWLENPEIWFLILALLPLSHYSSSLRLWSSYSGDLNPLEHKGCGVKHQGPADIKGGFVNCECQLGLRKFMACHTVLDLSQEKFSKGQNLQIFWFESLGFMLVFLNSLHYFVTFLQT